MHKTCKKMFLKINAFRQLNAMRIAFFRCEYFYYRLKSPWVYYSRRSESVNQFNSLILQIDRQNSSDANCVIKISFNECKMSIIFKENHMLYETCEC